MFIDELADYLEDQGVGVVGTDIFKGYQPADPIKCLVVYTTGGLAPDPEVLGIKSPTIEILCRGENLTDAQGLADAAYNALHGKFAITIGSTYVYIVEALQEPTIIGHDENGNFEVTCNYLLKVR